MPNRALSVILAGGTFLVLTLLLLGAEWVVQDEARDPILDLIDSDSGYDLRSRDGLATPWEGLLSR